MPKQEAERLLEAGAKDKDLRMRLDAILEKEDFVKAANEEGFDFTIEELNQVLREAGDSFDSSGNPPKRDIWWF